MTGLFAAAAATFAAERRDRMRRLYQWLGEQASFFRYDTVGRRTSRVRTTTTVRREGVTLLVGTATALGLDICPLCGSKLTPEQSEESSRSLTKGTIPQTASPADSQPP